MLDFLAVDKVAAKLPTPSGPILSRVPASTRKNVYLHPWHLSMSQGAKYGTNGKWPSTVAIRAHFPLIVGRGYESEREALEIKFEPGLEGKEIQLFQTGYIDGHAKGVMVQGVFALLDYLEPQLIVDVNIPQCCRCC